MLKQNKQGTNFYGCHMFCFWVACTWVPYRRVVTSQLCSTHQTQRGTKKRNEYFHSLDQVSYITFIL
jgi:hypothetical protein